MSNLGLEHGLERIGAGFVRTRVGDRYIMERLRRDGGVLGGEPSGHIICRDRTTTGDGIIAALQVLAELVSAGRSLHEIAGEIEKYPQHLINVRLDRPLDVLSIPGVQDAVTSAERELNGRGRVLLRPSGTEPLIRVMVEGMDDDLVLAIANRLADTVRAQLF
jgi:phosphoglucosamine mutase